MGSVIKRFWPPVTLNGTKASLSGRHRVMSVWLRFLLPCVAFGAAIARGDDARTMVFFGDSLTAGYGLDDPAAQAYPARIQEKIDAAGMRWHVVNAGLSG